MRKTYIFTLAVGVLCLLASPALGANSIAVTAGAALNGTNYGLEASIPPSA